MRASLRVGEIPDRRLGGFGRDPGYDLALSQDICIAGERTGEQEIKDLQIRPFEAVSKTVIRR